MKFNTTVFYRILLIKQYIKIRVHLKSFFQQKQIHVDYISDLFYFLKKKRRLKLSPKISTFNILSIKSYKFYHHLILIFICHNIFH